MIVESLNYCKCDLRKPHWNVCKVALLKECTETDDEVMCYSLYLICILPVFDEC